MLQAARIGVAADRVELELSLTPGIAVADAVIGGIDRDRDGVLSAEEQRHYAALVMAATELRIDGRIVNMAGERRRTRCRPSYATAIDRSSFDRPPRSPRCHPALTRSPSPTAIASDISVYLANALKPDSERIVIASQRRDPAQRTLAIDFTNDGNRFAALPAWLFVSGAAAWLTMRRRLLLSRHES